MKIRTWIKYEESYLPPRCRKLRYKRCEEHIDVNLREVKLEDLRLAFEDNSYQGKGKIYSYKNKLWSKVKMPNLSIIEGLNIKTPLDYLVWCNDNCSTYFFFEFDREIHGVDTSRQAVIKRVRKNMNTYLLVDGELYCTCAEPRYVVNTFGLGHNHGGTGMFCGYFYNDNIGKQNYFSALEGDKAVAYANYVAKRRGDTNDVGKFKPFIICHMPELVKIKPNKQHGNGNKFLNDVEDMICNTDNIMEAGLLAMCMCSKE